MAPRSWMLGLAIAASASPASASEYFVSLSGNDQNPGSLARPYATFAKGVSVLTPGDTLSLRQGVYVGTFAVRAKQGTVDRPITIRSYPGEMAYLDGTLSAFRTLGAADWEPASLTDPAAPPDEYVSTVPVTDFVRGAFLGRNPYTRLITYSDLADLRAANETFGVIAAPATDPRCAQSGAPAPLCEAAYAQCADTDLSCTRLDGSKRYRPRGWSYPRVYMGPGIWIDPAVSASQPARIHIRLAPTHNQVAGVVDWAGPGDPRQVALAISPKGMITLEVQASSHVRFVDLTVRFGGLQTVKVENSQAITFHGTRVLASSIGVRSNGTTGMTFRDSTFDGGAPPWMFRSDKKEEYYYFRPDGRAVLNSLGAQTLGSLLGPGATDTGMEIDHCELFNGHDVYSSVPGLRLHHSWIGNLDDEALIFDANPASDVQVYQNVIEQTLSPISFAGLRPGGSIAIVRNVIDLRKPTAGQRPRFPGDTAVWRYGSPFKSNTSASEPFDGPYDLIHNTFLVHDPRGVQAAYLHYGNGQVAPGAANLRRSFNNIFFAVNPGPATAYDAITFVPVPTFPAATDGNDYFQLGNPAVRTLRHGPYACGAGTCPGGYFASLAELRASALFQASKAQYPPGYEARSIASDPRFARIGGDGAPRSTDDLRLAPDSPAIGAGVALDAAVRALDPLAPPPGVAPDIGCYPAGGAALAVGVAGRKRFPAGP
jgi:hypothetical protein